jgi:hypothetical protein
MFSVGEESGRVTSLMQVLFLHQSAHPTCAVPLRTQLQQKSPVVATTTGFLSFYCDFYGEKAPGREQEAYAVQSIAHELMAEFARRMSAR